MALSVVERGESRQMQLNRGRAALNRKYQRVIKALKLLLESGIIARKEFEDRSRRLESLKKYWLDENVRPVGGRRDPGRPRLSSVSDQQELKCKRPGCTRPPAEGQTYCSREHAPFGTYGLQDESA